MSKDKLPPLDLSPLRYPNEKYWAKRAKQLEEAKHNLGESYIERQKAMFEQALSDIEEKLSVFYSRFADHNNITYSQAKEFLTDPQLAQFHMSLDEYIRLGETLNIDFDQDTWDEMENASIRYRVTRLEAIEMEIKARLEALYTDVKDNMYECMAEQYREAYFRSAFNVFQGYGVGIDFMTFTSEELELLLLNPWDETGNDFSSSVWFRKRQMMTEMPKILTQGVIQGQSYRDIAFELSKALNKSMRQCEVLVRTESAFFSTQGELSLYQELGIEEYKIVATLDKRTTEICQDMDGLKFKVEDAKPWKTCPPFNYQCRTTTVPVTPVDEIPHYYDDATRWARNKDGKSYRVPYNLTYHEWAKTAQAQLAPDYWEKFKARHGSKMNVNK